MSLKAAGIEQFQHFSEFDSLKEFNNHMEMWMALLKHEFSKGELVGLKRLVRFAAKIPGVCNAKIGTILKAIHAQCDGNGISRSTFKRMVQKAIHLGILTVHETERKNGSQSSNLYVFNRFPKSEPLKAEKLNHPNTSNPLKTNNQNDYERSEVDFKKVEEKPALVSILDHTFTGDQVPVDFKNLVKCFFPEASMIEEYWKMVSISARKYGCQPNSALVIDIAAHSFRQMIRRLKSGNVDKPIAYFYGILSKKLKQQQVMELFESVFDEGRHEVGF